MERGVTKIAKTEKDPFVLDGWRVDPAALRISNGEQEIKLEPKAMAVLDYLACRPNTVISRQELEEQIWAGSVVGYDALSNAIIKLRKAFGDNAREPHVIETIAKTGYRLIAGVSLEREESPPDTRVEAPALVEKDRLSDKLAVILHADVAGSTELVHQDKQLAHERIRDSFNRFSETIEKYHGRVLELRGDALLASFERGSDAVTAALAFQADQAYQNSRLQDDIRPVIRVGISMGEVVIADNTVTGTGVVQAQRVEQLAGPGGICITAAMHDSLAKRLPFEFVSLGEKELKGFDHAIHVYRVELATGESIPAPAGDNKRPASPLNRKLITALVSIILLAAVGTVFWFQTQEPKVEAASIERMAFQLPDKPSIAILPFSNISGVAEQEYFADGMTDNLITDLSKLSGLFVVARNSSFSYKGQQVKVRQVAEELGVRYVLEGSVQRAGNQVRINAQLIDATTGGHVWADRYDGALDDVFELQDQVTLSIVEQLAINLSVEDSSAIVQVETSDPDAYDLFLHGWELYQSGIPANYARAIAFLEKAIARDPGFSRAQAALAAVYWDIFISGWWQQSLGMSYYPTLELARVALKRSQQNPTVLTHQIAAEWIAYWSESARRTLIEAERALELDPNHPAGHMAMAVALLKDKRLQEAELAVRKAMRLDPHYPAAYLIRLAQIQFHLENYQGAAESLQTAVDREPNDSWAHIYLAAAYGQLNQADRARQALARADELRADAGFGPITIVSTGSFYLRKRWHGNRTALIEGLRIAGAPTGGEWFQLIERDGETGKVKGATAVDATEAKALYDRGAIFVDVHPDWFNRRIPGSYFLEWWQIEGWEFNEVALGELADKNQEIVIYSEDPFGRTFPASALAVSREFKRIYTFQGGLDEWKSAGYPVDTSKKH